MSALILSPLLNLPPGPSGGGATLIQHVTLRSWYGDGSEGAATISIASDRRTLTATVHDRHGHQSFDVRLRRLGSLASEPAEPADRNLRVLEVTRRPCSGPAMPLQKQVVLSDGPCPSLSPRAHRPLTASCVDSIRPEAILGLSAKPTLTDMVPEGLDQKTPLHSPHDLTYLRRRLADELAAAVKARLAVATSRHVELATLYAREIQGRSRAGAAL